MSSNLPNLNPANYIGVRSVNPPQQYFMNRPPTPSDYQNFVLGDEWLDRSVSPPDWYKLAAKTGGVSTWILLSDSGAIQSLTGDDLIPVSSVADNINLQGGAAGAISFTSGGPGQMNAQILVDGTTISIVGNQLVSNVIGLIPWIEVAINTLMSVNNGYIVNAGGVLTMTLPAISASGDVIEITDKGLNGFVVQAAGGDTVVYQGISSTVGGGWSTVTAGCYVKLLCVTANSRWDIITSQGNFLSF